MDEAKIATRADISETDKWDLTHLFADVGKWQEDFAWLQRTYPKLQNWKGRVGESAQTLEEVLDFEKSLDLGRSRICSQRSAKQLRFLYPKFWRSTKKRLPNSLPILRSLSGESSCTSFDE